MTVRPPRRPLQPMPPEVSRALDERGLRTAYDARPSCQRNDYRLDRPGAAAGNQQRRLMQMPDELEQGGVYMRMRWPSGT